MDLKTYLSVRGRGAALARLLDVSPVMLSQWTADVEPKPIPAERCLAIQQATRGLVTCQEMRPDLPWDVVREQVAPAPEAAHTEH